MIGIERSSSVQTCHMFTVDVEEYFHVSAFEGLIDPGGWDQMESRLEHSMTTLLEILARHGVLGTFFVLGWVAERHAALVRRIGAAGHEVASHGWSHTRLTRLAPTQFRLEVQRSKAVLEDLIQQPVRGFRAPSFSLVPGGEWALDILIEEGYAYDSSLIPISRSEYGYPRALPEPHVLMRPAGRILELPMTSTRVARKRIPAAGGAYFRHFPYWFTRRALRDYTDRGVSAMVYLHPWEVDPGQPRVRCSPITRLRHYGGLRRMERRLDRLLSEFRFSSINRVFDVEPREVVAPRAATAG